MKNVTLILETAFFIDFNLSATLSILKHFTLSSRYVSKNNIYSGFNAEYWIVM